MIMRALACSVICFCLSTVSHAQTQTDPTFARFYAQVREDRGRAADKLSQARTEVHLAEASLAQAKADAAASRALNVRTPLKSLVIRWRLERQHYFESAVRAAHAREEEYAARVQLSDSVLRNSLILMGTFPDWVKILAQRSEVATERLQQSQRRLNAAQAGLSEYEDRLAVEHSSWKRLTPLPFN